MVNAMSDHIRPEWARGEPMSNTRAEDRDDAQRDREIARRQAALTPLRAELVAMLAKVQAVHDSGINLVDALAGLETAIDDVDFEMERE